LLAGKIKVDDAEYKINEDFIESTLRLADEVELDEMEAAKILLDVQDDPEVPGNSLLERGLIRFHLQREYLLNCMRLCIQISNDEELDPEMHDAFEEIVHSSVFAVPGPGQPATGKKIIPKCLDAMRDIRAWLQKIQDKITTSSMMGQAVQAQTLEFQEAIEFSRKALVTQHEILAVIMSSAIEKQHAETQDFNDFFAMLKKIDRYDQLLGRQLCEGMPCAKASVTDLTFM
jgi:nuclear pore complex protein Nup205